ncbi:hypothetical protein NK8_83510 (plasmid) [Caballeronia sp. NK8]|nr:hypothetical protein NK8_83510 [Caballeronia sp. NK8]
MDHRVPNENRITDSENLRCRLSAARGKAMRTVTFALPVDIGSPIVQDVARLPSVSMVPVSRMPDGCDNVASEISEVVTAQ